MEGIKIGPSEILKFIKPVEKSEPSKSLDNKQNPNPGKEQQQKPQEPGKGENIDIRI